MPVCFSFSITTIESGLSCSSEPLPDREVFFAVADTPLEDAYAALTRVETALDELGQELEYHYQCLGEVVHLDHEE